MRGSMRAMPTRRAALCVGLALWMLPVASISGRSAQQLLDRVLARVNGAAITLSDLNIAIGLGLVEIPTGEDPVAAGTRQLIDRQLQLAEVERFPPSEPTAAAIESSIFVLRTRAGERLAALMRDTGLDERRIHDVARDNLRIQAYLIERFGNTTQVSDEEVDAYYRAHADEFTRDGAALTFAAAEPIVRQRASAARRRATVSRWIEDLRMRAEIVDGSRR